MCDVMDLKKIKVHFILDPSHKSEEECSPAMSECYEECLSNKLLVDWIKNPLCKTLKFNKNHVYVFENFDGECFKKISSKNSCLLVGPYCLITCMSKSLPIPNVPTLTMAMYGVVITFSCLTKEVKANLSEKIRLMGGIVDGRLFEATTHLVVGKSNSPKYEKANELKKDIMTKGWIDAVYNSSQHCSLTHATDFDFNKYKCPIFYNTTFTVSGYSVKKKEVLQKTIETHGGIYGPSMQFQVTDILICDKPTGEKFTYAREWGLPCINSDWLTDSVQAGYSLPFKKYFVGGVTAIKCSTPTKGDLPSKFHNSDTSISMIQDISRVHLPETQSTCFGSVHSSTKLTPALYDSAKVINELDLNVAKKSDAFLDGCNIYLVGFDSNQEEKLRKIIKIGSGVRFTDLDESVTHVLLGAFSSDFQKSLATLSTKPHIVNVGWLKQCILLKSPASETPHLCFPSKVVSSVSKAPECPSPLSKKGLQMLISPAKPRPSPKKLNKDSPAARRLLQGYMDSQSEYEQMQSQQSPPPPPSRQIEENGSQFKVPGPIATQNIPTDSSNGTESSSINPIFFTGLSFIILGFNEEETTEISNAIREASGKIMNKTFHGIPDYVIVPFQGSPTHIVPTESIVTEIWLLECKMEYQVVDVQYYHLPIQVMNDATPLVDCVITISNYCGFERDFLAKLSQLLGAGYQEEFMKRDNPKNNKKASTHLVCPTCIGSKYKAAIKWKFPSVTKNWLLQCAKLGKRLPETNFLTGVDEHNQSYNVTILNEKTAHGGNIESTTNQHQSNATKEFSQKENDIETKENTIGKRKTIDSQVENGNNELSQQSSQFSQSDTRSANKKRKLSLLNPDNSSSSPAKKSSHDSSTISHGTKPKTKEERKKWEQLMDDLIDDDQIVPQSKKKDVTKTTNTSIVDNKNVSNTSLTKSTPGTQPSELVKTIDELNQQLSKAKTRNSKDSDEQSPPKRTSVHQRKYAKPATGQEESQPRVGWEDYVEAMEKNSKEGSSNESVPEKFFVLSNVIEDVKARYCAIVERLGGTLLSTNQCFESRTTHLIMETPLRSEKLLCSLASGKWILIPQYLEDSNRQKTFLPEQEYEFGNPFSANKMPKLEGQIVQYAKAAYRWRLKNGGAFNGMKATLYVSEKRMDSLHRLIQAGGGQVLPNDKALEGTHCFWEDSRVDLPIRLEDFARKGIFVLPPVYLADYLRMETPPNPVENLVGCYKSIFEAASR